MLLHNGKRYNSILASRFFEMARTKQSAAKKMTRRKRPLPQSPPSNSTTEQREANKAKPEDDKPSEKFIVPQAGPGGRDW